MLLYVGLLKGDGTEPSPDTGYIRPYTTEFDHIPEFEEFELFLFPDAKQYYGVITHVALFDVPEGGEPLKVMKLPEPVEVHEGVTPFLHTERLFRGVEVRARSLVRSNASAACKV